MMIKNVLKLRKFAPVSLQEKIYSPFIQGDYEWVEIDKFKIRQSYYYCFLLADGSHMPLPIVEKIRYTFWKYLLPKSFWEKIKDIYFRI